MFQHYDDYEEYRRKLQINDLDNEVEAVKLYLKDLDVKIDPQGSEIIQFFNGKNVFITGGTGFLGKSMVEKLLRSCQGIGGVFLLVRAKKGVNVEERLEKILKDPLFFSLMKLNPEFKEKIRVFQGDVALPKLGLSDEDRRFLVDNVDVIVHIAATTKFDEKIRLATTLNVVGTMEVLELALDCKKLKVFTHVSTAYSHCPRKRIDEVFYETPLEPKNLVKLVQRLSDEDLEKKLKGLLGDWPNTYTFTKAVAEEVVRSYSKKLKVCIIRPSSVLPTYREPLRGWSDNVFGAQGFVAGGATGLIRIYNVDPNVRAEMVPCDYVTNSTIAATYKTATSNNQENIYNFVSDRENYLKLGSIFEINMKHCVRMIPLRTLWPFVYIVAQNYYWYRFLAFFLELVPVYLIDLALFLMGKKLRLKIIYNKVFKIMSSVTYFTKNNWYHCNKNTQKLWNSLKDEDKRAFPFDMSKVDLDELYISLAGGLRTFWFREPWSNLKEARKRDKRLRIVNKALVIIFLVLACVSTYWILVKLVKLFI